MKIFFLSFLLLTTGNIYARQDSLSIIENTQNDTSFVSDTSLTDSTSLVKSNADSVIILNPKSFSEYSFFVYNRDIVFNDYRYAGDFFRTFSFAFIKDLGFIGQPNDTYLYAVPGSAVTIMNDGIYFNNRYTLQTDFNHIQTESIDSVEVINLPRGFLYGAQFNPVTVSFIEKDIYSKQPFTKIKYYEGPFGEAVVDGIFSINVLKRLNISAEVSNKKVDHRYLNSDFSIWRAGIKTKYFLSNSINILGSYYHVKSVVGFNGGVNVDSIATFTTNINSVLYDNVLAPVNYPTRFLKSTQHHFALRTIAKFFESGRTDIQLYYKFTLDEDYEPLNEYENKLTNKNKVIGVNAAQTIERDFWKLNLFGNYERQILNHIQVPYSVNDTVTTNSISLSATGSLYLFDSTVVPSFFSRISHQTIDDKNLFQFNENPFGLGADVSIILNKDLKIYAGISSFTQKFSWEEKIYIAEVGANLNYEFINAAVNVFNIKNYYVLFPYLAIDYREYLKTDLIGSSVKANIRLWNFSLETLTSLYKDIGVNNNIDLIQIPGMIFKGGIYFEGSAFDYNLDLKTGFVLNYIGKQTIPRFDYLKVIVDPSYKLDFTLAGQIQKVATVYFTWENLFDNEYFITPYYPMPGRGIRFGLSWELFN